MTVWTGRGTLTFEAESLHRELTGEQLRVRVDGLDVTQRCYEASNVDDYALVFCKDPHWRNPLPHNAWSQDGPVHRTPDGTDVCSHRLVGRVVIEPGDQFV